jgi:Uma2 family endonuclease
VIDLAQRPVDSHVIDTATYLRLEDAADVRHEFVEGRMYALAGASDAHNQIVVNIVATVRPQVRGTDCRIYANDMRLRVSSQLYYYPDVMVVCDLSDNEANIRSRPCALIEVLSPSTELIDQREKVLVYKQVPSLNTYVIVHQTERLIEHHYRIEGDIWGIDELASDGEFLIPCNDIRLTLDDLYEDVTFNDA